MGCGTSKVLPEPPKDVQLDLVKKVEPYTGHSDVYKHFIRDDCGTVIKAGSPSPPRHANPYPGNPLPAHVDQPEPRKNKVAKYRAKFDPRVTAKYDIKALIGRGSFSRVVRVEHKATKQPYAIKMIETKYREGREVCESELSVLRRVRHTNIIQLIEVFETQDRVYMVMELATGGELFDRIIAKGSFTERDATRVLQMVLDGVKYLHTLGITHRDLKPENLLYYHPGTDSKIMITDFGLASARKKGDDCLMKTTCGTPEYIAPEILVRKPYTNSVDMWALGVISYILLSGTMPFEDDNRTRLYRQILKGKYSYSGEVTNSSFTHSMWQKPSQSTETSLGKEDRTVTEPIPSEETNLGLKLTVIIVPALIVLCLLLFSGICIYAALRKREAKGLSYGLSSAQKSGCWKQIKQPFTRHQSTEFTISYNNEKETPQKLDLVTSDMADYQQPLMIGTGTVTRKGSTFRPMDTENEGRRGSLEFENHYHCPHRANRHEYALPLTSQEPEYATPIIERHIARENNFPSENGYNVPVLSSQKHSLPSGSFSSSCKTDARNGDYQTPQSVINYDKPKANGVLTSVSYSTDYQKPQPNALGSEGYSTPRDCLKPISQTAMTALL